VLESQAARHAAETSDRDRLQAILAQLRACPVGADANLEAITEAGRQLHSFILESCPNRLLAGTVRSLHEHFRRFRSLSLSTLDQVLSSHREHLEIAGALSQGDSEAAARLVNAHLEHAARYLIDSVLLATSRGGPRIIIGSGK